MCQVVRTRQGLRSTTGTAASSVTPWDLSRGGAVPCDLPRQCLGSPLRRQACIQSMAATGLIQRSTLPERAHGLALTHSPHMLQDHATCQPGLC